eukprot:5075071-Pyramimonas_sp.AAC.1
MRERELFEACVQRLGRRDTLPQARLTLAHLLASLLHLLTLNVLDSVDLRVELRQLLLEIAVGPPL